VHLLDLRVTLLHPDSLLCLQIPAQTTKMMPKGDHKVCPALAVPPACDFACMFPLVFRVALLCNSMCPAMQPYAYVPCSKDTLLALNIVVIVHTAQAAAKCNQHSLLHSRGFAIDFLIRLSHMCRASRSWGTHPDVLQSPGGPHNPA